MDVRRGSLRSVYVLLGICCVFLVILSGPDGAMASAPTVKPVPLAPGAASSSALPQEGTPTINQATFKLQMQNGVVLVCKLTLQGTNFESGCVVLIDGQPAPKSHYDASTQVVAKGGAKLKKMLPKGRALAITVRNPGGQTSAPWSFTRP
jgi:hypothetical protein